MATYAPRCAFGCSSNTAFVVDDKQFGCTVSIGTALLQRAHRLAPSLYDAADKRLEEAKAAGRNRVGGG